MPVNICCCVDGCKNSVTNMAFCKEHYDWFKTGLINKHGMKSLDFDKQYKIFLYRKTAKTS